MKTSIERSNDIISLPEDEEATATLVKIVTPNGGVSQYTYKVQYRIRLDRALGDSVKANVVEISLLTQEPQPATSRTFDVSNPQKMVENLLVRTQRAKDVSRTSQQLELMKLRSDFTKVIPNSETGNLATASKQIQNFRALNAGFIQRTTDVPQPVVESQLIDSTEDDSTTDSAALQLISTTVLRNNLQDPAVIAGSRTNSVKTAYQTTGGLVSKTTRAESDLVKSFVLQPKTGSDSSKLASTAYVAGMVTDTTRLSDPQIVTEHLSFDDTLVQGSVFYLQFKIRNSRGVVMQTISKVVNHKTQVATYRLPVLPPTFLNHKTTPSGQGQRTFWIKQNDPNGTSIRLYKRAMNANKSLRRQASYNLVDELPALPGANFARFVDYSDSTDPTIYRAIAVSKDGSIGYEFSSLVVQSSSKMLRKHKVESSFAKTVVIAASIQPNSITVVASEIPVQAVTLQLFRRDLSIKEQTPTKIGDMVLLEAGNSGTISVTDNSVSADRVYEYFAELISKTGKKEATLSYVVEFSPVTDNIVDVSITPPEVSQNGSYTDITFTINKEVQNNQTDKVKLLLTQQGFIGEFQDEIIADRSRLGDLFAVSVRRMDLLTGDTDNFGIVTDTVFSDRKLGIGLNIAAPQPGGSYRYIVTAHARDIESLLPTLTKTADDDTSLAYTYLPYEWLHPITLKQGNIVSENSLARNHAQSEFVAGTVVDIKEYDVTLPESLPVIQNLKSRSFGDAGVSVQWKVQGDSTKIDHYVVVLELNGQKTIVGKAHSITSNGTIRFIDQLTNGEVGSLVYEVTPVYYDYTRGVPSRTTPLLV